MSKTTVTLPLPAKADVILEDGRRRVPAISRPLDTIHVTRAHRAAIVAAHATAVAALENVAESNTARPVLAALVEGNKEMVRLLLGNEAVGGA